jgi:predicted RNase H-like HicB family nuclease
MSKADEPLEVQQGVILGYRVEYHRMPANWAAYTPDLPTILVAGKTREECEALMLEAIPFHLEGEALESPPRRRHRR